MNLLVIFVVTLSPCLERRGRNTGVIVVFPGNDYLVDRRGAAVQGGCFTPGARLEILDLFVDKKSSDGTLRVFELRKLSAIFKPHRAAKRTRIRPFECALIGIFIASWNGGL
jgi:hypothetical protein